MAHDKPNILVIWGDDIGISNLSCYSDGLMGYRTPNIDRIAEEGARFTDYYGEQSCTAGRAAFITGQNPIRTGLTKVGLPGAEVGMQDSTPTIATALKAKGYATGQFGKNHLGDRDEHLPTMHGFDEFFGNLYHLNAEEEPELDDYPTPEDFPAFRERFGPRGVLHTWANGDGTQRIEDTGPLTRERRVHRGGLRFHPGPGGVADAVLRVVQLHPHAFPHAYQAGEPGPGRSLAVELSRHDDRP
jgi:arylsulfatase A-like enzyme